MKGLPGEMTVVDALRIHTVGQAGETARLLFRRALHTSGVRSPPLNLNDGPQGMNGDEDRAEGSKNSTTTAFGGPVGGAGARSCRRWARSERAYFLSPLIYSVPVPFKVDFPGTRR